MVAGDGSFGLIKKLYRKTTVDCVNHIVKVVKRSNAAGLKWFTKNQHFLFEAANPGIVRTQLVANGAYTEFN